MTPLIDTLSAAIPHLSAGFRERTARLWVPEHLAQLTARLEAGPGAERPSPHFAAETTPPVGPVAAQVSGAVGSPVELAAALERIGLDGLLLLLGQRRTSASLTDERAIPPTDAELLTSANRRHHPNDELTVAARALAKHAHRSPDRFWGEATGPTAARNVHAAGVLTRILAGRTWWNVFGHFTHDTVFEARLPSGHGARWGHAGTAFVGFLEPFDEAKCPSLNGGV
jgi:hypothetical protein